MNDCDPYILVPLLRFYVKECQITVMILKKGSKKVRQLQKHMRDIGFEHLKKTAVCTKRYDNVRNGLNAINAFGQKCEHTKPRWTCIECQVHLPAR